jgi:hypothetical protein
MGVVPVRPQARERMAEAIEDCLEQLGVNPRERGQRDEEGRLVSTTDDSIAEIISNAAVQAFLAAEEIQSEYDLRPDENDNWDMARFRRLCGPWRRDDDLGQRLADRLSASVSKEEARCTCGHLRSDHTSDPDRPRVCVHKLTHENEGIHGVCPCSEFVEERPS